jgi:hypothetical protein
MARVPCRVMLALRLSRFRYVRVFATTILANHDQNLAWTTLDMHLSPAPTVGKFVPLITYAILLKCGCVPFSSILLDKKTESKNWRLVQMPE